MYTCVITLCLGSHLLADHSGMKYYSTTMFTAQMMGYLFVAASYTTTTIVSIKNLQNHVRFLRQFTNLIGKVSMLDGIEINVPLNRSKIIGLLLTVHVLFNIFIHLFWFPIWDVLIVLMIKSYTFELLTAMIMHSYLYHIAIMLNQQNAMVLKRFEIIMMNRLDVIGIYEILTIIEQFDGVKELFQISFGEQFLQRAAFDVILITIDLFGCVLLSVAGESSVDVLKQIIFDMLPHILKNVSFVLSMEEFGLQVNIDYLYLYIYIRLAR